MSVFFFAVVLLSDTCVCVFRSCWCCCCWGSPGRSGSAQYNEPRGVIGVMVVIIVAFFSPRSPHDKSVLYTLVIRRLYPAAVSDWSIFSG